MQLQPNINAILRPNLQGSFVATVIMSSLLLLWFTPLVVCYEIWSVYFDDTMPSINIENRIRKQLFRVPFNQNRHIIEIVTYLNGNNQNLIRHMELSMCKHIESSSTQNHLPNGSLVINGTDGASYVCLQRIVTQTEPISANKTVLRLPEGIGLPLDATKTVDGVTQQALLLSIEYVQDYHLFHDDSGFDLLLSDEPMPVESAIVAVGLVPDHRFLLPPNMTEWLTSGHCYSSCLNQKLYNEELTITAIFPSATHRALDELTLTITESDRKSRKIYAWGGDNSVDFVEEPVLKVGAQLTVQCTYKTPNMTITGGLSKENENCLLWLHYYPRTDLEACMSSYSAATIMSLLEADQLKATMTPDARMDVAIGDQLLAEYVLHKDQISGWNKEKLNRSRYNVATGRQMSQCGWQDDTFRLLRRRR